MVTGMGIPGGYAGKGITGMDTDTYFGIQGCTRTRIRHTRTHNGGYTCYGSCRTKYIQLARVQQTYIQIFFFFYNYIFSPLFFSTMARDEVDLSLITNDHRKRKLGSYATNKDNISADKDEVVKHMKHTINASAAGTCEQ